MQFVSLKSLLWRAMVRWLARSQGFLDPLTVLSQLSRFGQPAEVIAPTELLRAGAVFHVRGLMNSQAIQHNLDWVWPYWVVRQFDPHDPAFVPRAFSITHINLTHRNWTAVGLPDVPELPIVDPRGLLTPHFDGWSLDGWMVTADRKNLIPSQQPSATQRLLHDEGLAITTEVHAPGLQLDTTVQVVQSAGAPACQMRLIGQAASPGWLVVALRPYNPEGVGFIHDVAVLPDRMGWLVNKKGRVTFSLPPEKVIFSHYRLGDVYHWLQTAQEEPHMHCSVGMATAAALFALEPGQTREVTVQVPLAASGAVRRAADGLSEEPAAKQWPAALHGHCTFTSPDPQWQFLYDAAIRTLILHAPEDVYPGPYTYKRFWFRDAAFIVHAMLCAGLTSRAERVLDRFPARQKASGHFCSQDGEWDSNGQALWIFRRFCQLTGRPPKSAWQQPIHRAARWIQRRRLSEALPDPHAGLLPAGFSAEHLGPNDYYYWDDFWSVAGFRAAAGLADGFGDLSLAERYRADAERFLRCIDRSLKMVSSRLGNAAIPASPYRRMDAGAIGSIAAGYPLQLWDAHDPRLMQTVEFLLTNCFVGGGFFQNISHSGINPYLTLHVAQVLLRAEDDRYRALMQAIVRLATPTGQWPEAIHPATLGGCMGDGQHVWAAAEWILMLRNCFVREEQDERLVLGSGIPADWCRQSDPISFGPAPTTFGDISISIAPAPKHVTVSWTGRWHRQPPSIEVRLPGFQAVTARPGGASVVIERT